MNGDAVAQPEEPHALPAEAVELRPGHEAAGIELLISVPGDPSAIPAAQPAPGEEESPAGGD